ncbi:hypothetical protein SNOG_07255 [Parastagonospora nodorum SN15]|uniref:Uncharacterized protein n=1 Tax=Phaeosphaeria nodorum (strain SN15 / ATCC MYA-4574 / FGSC 10173) TaxID=321614 RepID=Q0ULV9_PHANO|nr:hypothetical protein SNOG_07255 [Parastagonospora nodorum SN15]EAT85906.1 hypothetical protein SNOG_07255 [Parastagonospora nodorum SN15]
MPLLSVVDAAFLLLRQLSSQGELPIFWTINQSLWIRDEYLFTVLKGADDDSTRIPKPDLKDGVTILTPPLFADCRMVISQLS